MHHPFDDVTESALRRRSSAKWAYYGRDVLPAWVAEMDYPIAEPMKRVLHAAIDDDDCGYADPAGLGEAFAPWAKARWGWEVKPADVHVVCDVVTGLAEILRVATAPGDGVVIEPPVYHPFASTVEQLGRAVVTAPLVKRDGGHAPDLDAIERAYARGARVHLLCSPQNPSGMVYPEAALVRIAELADRYGVLVLSDEIHAPLTLPGAVHRPFPAVSAAAARRSIVLTSASKTWNLAGLKAAVMVASSDEARAVLARLPPETPYHAGHLGILAARAAFREGDAWLASTHRDPRPEPQVARRAPARAHAERGVRAAAGRVSRVARLLGARSGRRPCEGLPRAREGGALVGAAVRGGGRGLRAAEHRHDTHAARGGRAADGERSALSEAERAAARAVARGRTPTRIERGDWQTPAGLARAVLERVVAAAAMSGARAPRTVIEPTCGEGTFLVAAGERFARAELRGYEIDAGYTRIARMALREHGARARVVTKDFFATDWERELAEVVGPVLVVGNPPWVTTAQLGVMGRTNAPDKSNERGLQGLDARTGKSNFDVSEWMIERLLEALEGREATVAMLLQGGGGASSGRDDRGAWAGRGARRPLAHRRRGALRRFGVGGALRGEDREGGEGVAWRACVVAGPRASRCGGAGVVAGRGRRRARRRCRALRADEAPRR